MIQKEKKNEDIPFGEHCKVQVQGCCGGQIGSTLQHDHDSILIRKRLPIPSTDEKKNNNNLFRFLG